MSIETKSMHITDFLVAQLLWATAVLAATSAGFFLILWAAAEIDARLMGRDCLRIALRELWGAFWEAGKETILLMYGIPWLSITRWQPLSRSEAQLRDWMDRKGWVKPRDGMRIKSPPAAAHGKSGDA
ncbi:MAG: hypothetical protein KGO02_14255 [Alphaproteobacteria bacterium]|jgi:hypothetical protein|nr:hypothetical protein [Alphaproteobacteria bacterium]